MSIFRCFEQFSSTMKTPKQTYHSRSLQEKAKIIEEHLKGVSKAKLMENYKIPISNFLCEPKLQKRNLYNHISIKRNKNNFSRKILNFLQYSDGKNNLEKISKLIKLSQKETEKIYKILNKKKLIV